MKQILWFRRDLRVSDNAILANGKDEVLPIFIFDTNILATLPANDKRVSFIYKSVLNLKKELQNIGLDLAIFFGVPKDIFIQLQNDFDEVLCSCDFDSYAISRDKEIEQIIPMRRFYDSYLVHPDETLKLDGTPYKVFTPFYKNLQIIWESVHIKEYSPNQNLTLVNYDYATYPTLEQLGFTQTLQPHFLKKSPLELIENLKEKLEDYKEDRDFFYKDGTSNLSVFLRFGIISPKQIFNLIRNFDGADFFIRELFWREFYNTILYHFPKSEFENFNQKNILWENDEKKFQAWCDGKTGVPIIDASMQHLNSTGTMPNRLRMVVASFLCKNLLCDWRLGERYFALKLLDYDTSSNVGSWQWGASTGADSVPYFRVFNPYLQSAKFDKEAIFIKSVLKEFQNTPPKELHKENEKTIVNIKLSSKQAIALFKNCQS
jgi:deoxyribodipyrimidine photo-lyase